MRGAELAHALGLGGRERRAGATAEATRIIGARSWLSVLAILRCAPALVSWPYQSIRPAEPSVRFQCVTRRMGVSSQQEGCHGLQHETNVDRRARARWM